MSLRARLTLTSALAVAVAIAIASVFVYITVRGQQRASIDDSLRTRMAQLRGTISVDVDVFSGALRFTVDQPTYGGAGGYFQFVDAGGHTARPRTETDALPVDAHMRGVAAGTSSSFLTDMQAGGTHVRVLTSPFRPGLALQVARPLDEVDSLLAAAHDRAGAADRGRRGPGRGPRPPGGPDDHRTRGAGSPGRRSASPRPAT